MERPNQPFLSLPQMANDVGFGAPGPLGRLRNALARVLRRSSIRPPSPHPGPSRIPGEERVWGRETYFGLGVLDTMLRRARGVGCIERVDAARAVGIGTGFLVAPDLLLTCRHVLEHEQPSRLRVRLSAYERGRSVLLGIRSVPWIGRDLDAALVELHEAVNGDSVLPLRLSPPEHPVERAFIIGHPNGGRTPKVSLHDSRVLHADANVLQYRTPTDPGSSGSPILDDDLDVVGIHARSYEGDPRGPNALNEGLRIEPVWEQIAPFVLRGRPPDAASTKR